MQLSPPSVQTVLRRFKENGYRNCKTDRRNCGGRRRRVIGSREFEELLLSNEVMQKMAPLCMQRRVDYIQQKYGVHCNYASLRLLYIKNNVTWRVSSRTWKITAEELPGLNE